MELIYQPLWRRKDECSHGITGGFLEVVTLELCRQGHVQKKEGSTRQRVQAKERARRQEDGSHVYI